MTYGSESECATHYTTAPHKQTNDTDEDYNKTRRDIIRNVMFYRQIRIDVIVRSALTIGDIQSTSVLSIFPAIETYSW